MSNKIRVVTLARLNRALARVRRELDQHGFWDDRLAAVDVYLVPAGVAYGWQYYGSTGEICIPALSLLRLSEVLGRRYTSLADVVRHEYGHAFADTHRGLIRSRRFRAAFGTHHNDERRREYDPDEHVSAYAATAAYEDLAEVFMLYLKHGGTCRRGPTTPSTDAKRGFVADLAERVRLSIA